MTQLQFGSDYQLREREHVLAFVAADGREEALGRLVADEVEQAIVTPPEPADWSCDLLDDGGRRAGGFEPFRLRRGGRLCSGELSVSLQGYSWSHDRWSFATADGHCVEVTVERLGGAHPLGSGAVEIALEPAESAGAAPLGAHAALLAFGCWLIAQWHACVPGDHMLTTTGVRGSLTATRRSLGGGGQAG